MSERPFDIKGRLARHRWVTRTIMIFERLWSAAFVPISMIGAFVALSWFGVFRTIPYWLGYILAAILAIAFLVSLRNFMKFRLPSDDEVNSRLEDDNQIDHEGIAVQLQSISQAGDQSASALWKEHQARMWAKLSDVERGKYQSDIPDRDPYALRVLVLLLLVSGFAYSFSGQSGRLTDVVNLRPPVAQSADLMRIDAWVTPPAYTNRAPIFLNQLDARETAISIPEQSKVTIRIVGFTRDENAPQLDVNFTANDGTILPLTESDESTISSISFDYIPDEDGTLNVLDRHSWQLAVVEDNPPEIEFHEEPTQAQNGALQLAYKTTDDYGVVSARAEITSIYDPDDHALQLYEDPIVDLQLPRRSSEDGLANTSYDLTDHPLAGEEVYITLVAIDGAGQETRTEPLQTILPAKNFVSLLAQSIIEQRQIIAFDAYERFRAIELNDALTIIPEVTIPSIRDFLLVKSAREGLALAYSDEALLRSIDELWEIALLLEDGNLSLAEQRLRDAQRELSEALENGATDEEIAQLMQELREAMQEFMEALAQQNNNNNQQPQNQQSNVQELEQQDLQDMLDQIEDMARSGNREQAQQMLQDLQNMMNNLQANRQQQQQQNGEQSPIEQQMEELGQILRQQQQLMDQTFDLQQQQSEAERQRSQNQQNNQNNQNSQNNQNGQQEPMTPEELADALEQLRQQQEALQEQLEQLMWRMEEEGLEPTEGLGEAGEAMGQAEGELGEGNTGEAGTQQGRALQALREGAQEMLNQLQQQMQAQGQGQGQGEQQGQQQGQQGQGNQRDPLGRQRGGEREGIYGHSENGNFDDADNVQRAREILEIIRRRLGENFRLEFEKEYLERLLKPTE
ncbi:MAG: TIGR02302 family protein [Rhizobiaceae bacterium]|nr:TIGR02302 family protein [Rhizobiaceae bacterium]